MTGGGDVNDDIRDGLALGAIVRKRVHVSHRELLPSNCVGLATNMNLHL